MSTDYGFGCVDCTNTFIVGRVYPEDLRWCLDNLDLLVSLKKADFLLIRFLGGDDYDEAIEFAKVHRDAGHVVDAFDEYGHRCTREGGT